MSNIDNFFTGTWKGTDHGSLHEDEVNHWIVTRTKEGQFFVDFTTYFKDGTIEKSFEKGSWYVANNLFYEKREGEHEADVYTYKILSEKSILFKDSQSDYHFIDDKVLLH